MAVQLTLGECVDAEAALGRLAALPWPPKTAYDMAKLLRLLRAETKIFEQQRVALIKELGEGRPPTADEVARGATGEDVFQVPQARMPAYLERYRALRDVQVALDWRALTLAQLADGHRLAGTDLLELGPLLQDDPPGATP
jgi:hypothetical protein